MKIVKHTLKTLINLIAFFVLSAILLYVWWTIAGKTYLFSPQPMGGDYFNALTYVNFFYHYLPLPPMGWIPLWNEGSPVIGGYPWLAFYLMFPLIAFFEPAFTMEIFASISLALFFLASLLLFRQVSKNWLVAFSLALILVVTKATYYPLMTGGFVISTTAQWYLALILLLIYKFAETSKKHYLVIASIFMGLSFLNHAPTSLIMIFLPVLATFLVLPLKNITYKKRVFYILIFSYLSFVIGSSGLYTVFLQNFLGSGTDACNSPECWGIYPKHLVLWMTPLTLMIIAATFILAILAKVVKRSVKFFSFMPALAGFVVFFLYGLFAYLHFINGLANVIFPTRIFWAANLFLLLIAAHLYRSVHIVLPKVSLIVSIFIVFLIGISLYYYPPTIHKDRVNIDPIDSYLYTIPKYKTHELSSLFPDWIPLRETNWRLDTFNPGLTQWWNFISPMPSTRGYSDHPIGVHRDWQYLLQYATRDPKLDNEELVKNRALFLLDAFAIGFHENSIASYPQSILTDPKIVARQDELKNFTWYQFSSVYVSPIVSPTNSNPVLFIGDNTGYDNFIRTIAMTNLNSFSMIPVKGPQDIGSVSDEELKKYKAIVCYQFTGNNWSKITNFAKNGGLVFIETASLKNHPGGKLAEIFPVNSLSLSETKTSFDKSLSEKSGVATDIKVEEFSPLVYNGGPWKQSTSNPESLRVWATPVVQLNNNLLLAQGKLGKGQVVWSGMNLIYHTVKYDNYEEAKLFANILKPITTTDFIKPAFKITRTDPRIINITGTNINGVYFKENYDSGWTATSNGKKIPVHIAGLEFMYIPIPESLNNEPQHIILSFNGSRTSWLLFNVSILTLILTIIYLIIPHPFHALHRHTHHHIRHKVIKRVHTWWQKEEE